MPQKTVILNLERLVGSSDLRFGMFVRFFVNLMSVCQLKLG
jgi:hypothetical protein